MGTWRARWVGVMVTACLLTLAACGSPPGVDGDLTNNWPAFPEPKLAAPTVGECLTGAVTTYNTFDPPLTPVDCTAPHTLEVVYVGQFSATTSAATAAPSRDSSDARAAFAECERAAGEYLGGDWHDSRLFLHYSQPTAPRWEAGARFFSCSVFETSNLQSAAVTRTGSVKGGLSSGGPLTMRCFNQTGTPDDQGFYSKVEDIPATDCAQPHTAEYAGTLFLPDGPYPTGTEAARLSERCWPVVARFVGLSPDDLSRRSDIYSLGWSPNKNQWPIGDRAVPCLATVSANQAVRGSIKGLGSRPLPA